MAAVELKKANARLAEVMRQLVIRHRRDTECRRYRVGHEYPAGVGEEPRPDQHQLHAARGSILPDDAELAQFLLMKVVASATCGRRKTALGMDVTGAYSTLWNSKEGRKALDVAANNEAAQPYFRILAKLTDGRSIPNRCDRTRTNDYEPLPKWRNAARRPSCQDAITLLRKQIEAKPLCQGTPTNILGYPSMIRTAAA